MLRAMKQLQGKVAVVTGAASGIGLAFAQRFARDGMKLVLADIEEAPLAAAHAALTAAGAEAIAVRTDVAKADSVDALARATFERFGTAHVVCNNAGVGGGGLMWKSSVADWEWTLGVNLWGVIHGIRAFVPRMVEQGEGHVVNTASIAGVLSLPGIGPYCASKHAVVTISECLHHELMLATGGKVRCSVVCPGFVKTKIWEAERNRPEELRGPARPPEPFEQQMQGTMKAAVEGGIPAERVADLVAEAIVGEKFYVFPHPELKKAFERRVREIVGEQPPTFDFSVG